MTCLNVCNYVSVRCVGGESVWSTPFLMKSSMLRDTPPDQPGAGNIIMIHSRTHTISKYMHWTCHPHYSNVWLVSQKCLLCLWINASFLVLSRFKYFLSDYMHQISNIHYIAGGCPYKGNSVKWYKVDRSFLHVI